MIRPIAYYLPQYHPIPENDKWWGKGFTEWTNVTKAKPLFRGHYQPRFPADLGYYDLRIPEVRQAQADMALENGIFGFCYYHYWFGNGRTLMDRPFREVLNSKSPNFPFMLCWANQTWKGVWFGESKGKTLIEQLYPGVDDFEAHFRYLESAFHDERYIKIDGKPVFHVYMPRDIPNLQLFVDTFKSLSIKSGLSGIYLLASNCPFDWSPKDYGFDGSVSNNFQYSYFQRNKYFKDHSTLFGKIERRVRYDLGQAPAGKGKKPYRIDYSEFIKRVSKWPKVDYDYFPQVIPNWDNSARNDVNPLILENSSPELFGVFVDSAIKYIVESELSADFIFVKSWNEWAEGNYLEPDTKWGHAYLDVMKTRFS